MPRGDQAHEVVVWENQGSQTKLSPGHEARGWKQKS